LTNFETVATSSVSGPDLIPQSFDIALANPPYFANHSIALLFIQRSFELLKRTGSFFMVTKQPNEMVDLMTQAGYVVEGAETRGYTVLMHRGPAAREDMGATADPEED
jgi:16S rRNA G1207 methylase RsmC